MRLRTYSNLGFKAFTLFKLFYLRCWDISGRERVTTERHESHCVRGAGVGACDAA